MFSVIIILKLETANTEANTQQQQQRNRHLFLKFILQFTRRDAHETQHFKT